MPSRARAGWITAVLATFYLVAGYLSMTAPVIAAASDEAVRQALDQVHKDPNLYGERTVRTLKWAKKDDSKPKEPTSLPDWFKDLFRSLIEGSRVLLWTLLIALVGLVALLVVRIVKDANYTKPVRVPANAPTHVRDLDIRPESLPQNLGETALTLWERNEHRAALALLYRGLLSRLVHSHGVPIKGSSTEAECLQLATPLLSNDVAQYVSQLVKTWQVAVYGSREPAAEEMRELCSRFDGALPAPASTGEPA